MCDHVWGVMHAIVVCVPGIREMATKRTRLSLKKKVELIRHAEGNPGIGVRALAEQFKCGRTQASLILKKSDFLSMFWTNMSAGSCHTSTPRSSEYAEVNKALYDWYLSMLQKYISLWTAID